MACTRKPRARDVPDRTGIVMTARDAGAEKWCFWLPIPPSVNEIWTPICRNGKGAFVKSKKYRSWLANANAALTVQDRPRDPLYGHITVAIDVPDTEKRDIDNLEKATLDVLEAAGILEDDKHVRHLGINRALDPNETEIRLHVRRYL